MTDGTLPAKAVATPGEWKLAGDESGFVYALNADGVNRMWFKVQPGFVEGMERTSDEEVRATAQLAMAAPELLEALEDALMYLRNHLPPEALLPHRWVIAKARGEAT